MSAHRRSPHNRAEAIRVLHVDDEPDFSAVLAGYLEQAEERFSVETATSASEGLDRLASTRFDCVVSDYEMPARTGIEFLESVRSEYPDLPFILYTGKGSEDVASEAISAGVTDYLQKRPGADQYTLLANRIRNAVEQYRSTRAVTAFRNRIEFALEVTDSIIFEVDTETRTEVRHGPFEQLFGLESESVPDTQSFLDRCVHPADREKVKSIQRPEELPNRDTVEQEFRTHPANGDVKWIHNEMYAERNAKGNPVRVIGHNTDVTKRKRYERRLERQNERLERLASVVSHDLRNPLNVAQGRIDLARSECGSDHLEDARSAVDRSLELVEDLLELARAGKQVREIEPVDGAEVVESSWQNVQTADAALVADLEAEIEADRSRLRQLFENLFGNAVEHGEGETTIAVGPLDEGFYVEDDGPGIPEAEREDVFETGYSSGDGGTGFGLSIVEEIVDAHDWEIRIREGSAGGARFEITDVEFADD